MIGALLAALWPFMGYLKMRTKIAWLSDFEGLALHAPRAQTYRDDLNEWIALGSEPL